MRLLLSRKYDSGTWQAEASDASTGSGIERWPSS